MKKLGLSSKLAIIISAMLVVVLTVLIAFSVSSSGAAIDESVSAEFDALSRTTSIQVQQIFDSAQTTAENMGDYLLREYAVSEVQNAVATPQPSATPVPEVIKDEGAQEAEVQPAPTPQPSATPEASKYISQIYNTPITQLSHEVEKFLIETSRNTSTHDEDIVGVGAMFEPYLFDEAIESYSFYIDENYTDGPIEPYGNYADYSKEIYYTGAMQSKQEIVTEPYIFDGVQMVTYAYPIIYKDVLQGVVIADVKIDNFKKAAIVNDRYKTMYTTIYNGDGTIIFDSEDLTNVGVDMKQFFPITEEYNEILQKFSQGQAFTIETTRETGEKFTRFYNPIKAANQTWWALTALATSDLREVTVSNAITMVLIALLALALIILAVIFVLRKMLNPMKDVVRVAESIAQGNLDVSLKNDSGDEIGTLSRSFVRMADYLKAVVQDVGSLLNKMGTGDFDVQTQQEYVGDFKPLLDSIHDINTSLSGTMREINQSADQVSSGSDQVSSGAQALSQGATEQASSVQELAATINEISSQVKDTAQNAIQASEQTRAASAEVTVCNQQMQDMINAMSDISQKSGEIGKIIKTIEDISFQTNILALNAAVEAARAGAAGKGFAVVADEVRNLASKSAQAAKSTTVLIQGSIQAVQGGTTIADETAKSLMKVVESTTQVSETVDKISSAANEQASSVAQVTQGIDQISNVVQTNSATAEESAAASEELSSQASMLKSLVSRFKLKGSGTQSGSYTSSQAEYVLPESSDYSSLSGDKY